MIDGIPTSARANEEAFDGAAVLAGANEVGIAGAAVSLQARDGSDCFPVTPGRAPEIVR